MTEIFTTIDDLRIRAAQLLPESVRDYIEATAMDGITDATNQADFRRLSMVPLTMRDVSNLDLSTSYLDRLSPLPFGISPMAFHNIVHPDGELASAKAAGAAGITYIVSSMASRSIEEIAEHGRGARLWLHVYLFRDRSLTYELIERAKSAGYEAIVLGMGCPTLGRRPKLLGEGFALPESAVAVNLTKKSISGLLEATAELDPAVTWEDVQRLCSSTNMPVIGKGIMNALDVEPSFRSGLAGLIVSNHGGRQLDTTWSSVRALPEILEAVDGRLPVFLDGGVRRGTDVLKAMALGAKAVFVGRPVLWGLASNGEQGVARMFEILTDELKVAMQLAGCPNLLNAYDLRKAILR